MAGLMPVKQQINAYMKRAAIRIRTVHWGHPARAALPLWKWDRDHTNIRVPYPLREIQKDAKSPMKYINEIAGAATTC